MLFCSESRNRCESAYRYFAKIVIKPHGIVPKEYNFVNITDQKKRFQCGLPHKIVKKMSEMVLARTESAIFRLLRQGLFPALDWKLKSIASGGQRVRDPLESLFPVSRCARPGAWGGMEFGEWQGGVARRRVVLLPRFPGWLRPPETRGNGAPPNKRAAWAALLFGEGGKGEGGKGKKRYPRQAAGLE
ncbi:hypothetical protein SAMN02745704_02696, partial [Paucidesulfovibrio gracilis DSM 16080]